MSGKNLTGHCYCGDVEFEIDGEPIFVGHCHCESCRRASGAVLTTYAGFRPDQVSFTGTMPSRFSKGKGVTRSFCGRCGASIAYEHATRPNEIHLHLGLFDDLEQTVPGSHSFYQEKPGWLHADEHLPRQDWDPEANR